MNNNPKVSVVMPCLNEEDTVAICVEKALSILKKLKIKSEVVVCDNGSTDRSVKRAKQAGARVVNEKKRGYGRAYLTGIGQAKGQYVIMADSDNTYDFDAIGKFVKKLDQGYEFVMGSRLRGDIADGAMPWAHRYIGTPTISFLLNLIFRTSFSDSQCGMRAFTMEAYKKMKLRTTGMEFASEMIVRSSRVGLKTTEVPINYGVRRGNSKLNTVRDGWRHIRFILLYSPTVLFIIPGSVALLLGSTILLPLLFGPVRITNLLFLDIHPMFLGSLLLIAGLDFIALGIFSRTYAIVTGLEEEDAVIEKIIGHFSLEKTIIFGLIFVFLGLLLMAYIFMEWVQMGFRNISEIRKSIMSLTLLLVGVKVIFYGFFLSILKSGKGDT